MVAVNPSKLRSHNKADKVANRSANQKFASQQKTLVCNDSKKALLANEVQAFNP
jgi:hypothetical protein